MAGDNEAGYLKVSDAAKVTGWTRNWIYRLIETGKLEAIERVIAGRGRKPTTLVSVESLLARLQETYRPGQHPKGPKEFLRIKRRDAERLAATVKIIEDVGALERRMLAEYDAGDPVGDIAARHSVSSEMVYGVLEAAGREIRQSPDYAAARRRQKAEDLDEATKRELIERYRRGEGYFAIAEALFGSRTRWKSVQQLLGSLGEPLRGRSEAAVLSHRRRSEKIPAGA